VTTPVEEAIQRQLEVAGVIALAMLRDELREVILEADKNGWDARNMIAALWNRIDDRCQNAMKEWQK
jgi:hypothetical protein